MSPTARYCHAASSLDIVGVAILITASPFFIFSLTVSRVSSNFPVIMFKRFS